MFIFSWLSGEKPSAPLKAKVHVFGWSGCDCRVGPAVEISALEKKQRETNRIFQWSVSHLWVLFVFLPLRKKQPFPNASEAASSDTRGKFHSAELHSCTKQRVNRTRCCFGCLLMHTTLYQSTPLCSLTNRTNKLSPMVAKSYVWRSEAFFNPRNTSAPASSLCGTYCVREANDVVHKGWAPTCCLEKQEGLRIYIHYFVGTF